MQDCVFCKIVDGKIPSNKIWENDKFVAFLDIQPLTTGHTLVIPKKHVDNIFSLDDKTYQDLFASVKKISNPLICAMSAKRLGVMVEGFLVPHAHVHLIPISSPGELTSSKNHKVTSKELEKIAEKIRNEI